VDDCSPDNCGDICEQYALKDNRIRVIHHTRNLGLPSARNTGIEALDAEWVSFIDSDDWVDPDMCEKLISYVDKQENKPEVIIFSGYRNYLNYELRSQPVYPDETWFSAPDSIDMLQRRSLTYTKKGYTPQAINLDSACWKLISTEFLRNKGLNFINVSYREDGLFFLYITQEASGIVYLDQAFYHYRSTSNSMVNQYRERADSEHMHYLQEVTKFARKYNKSSDWLHDFYYTVFLSMQICITQKFFNKENPNSYFARRKECKALFKEWPFCDVLKNLNIRDLRRNHMIKGLCIRLGWYGGVSVLRSLYLAMNKRKSYE
jgi:glycosyltransferase involved in cell wall biosynthesis